MTKSTIQTHLFIFIFFFSFSLSSHAFRGEAPELNTERNLDFQLPSPSDFEEPTLVEGQDYWLDGSENLPVVSDDDAEEAYEEYVENKKRGLLDRLFDKNKKSKEKERSNEGSRWTPTETTRRDNFESYIAPQGSKLVIEAYKNENNPNSSNYHNAPDGLREFIVAKLDGRAVLVAVMSTARVGTNPHGSSLSTPTGTFYGINGSSSKVYRSQLWDGSPMPYALFFSGGYALHGIVESYYGALGEPASGGCLRLSIKNAYKLWQLAESVGFSNVTVRIHSKDETPHIEDIGGLSMQQLRSLVSQSMTEKNSTYSNYRNHGYRSPYWPTGF